MPLIYIPRRITLPRSLSSARAGRAVRCTLCSEAQPGRDAQFVIGAGRNLRVRSALGIEVTTTGPRETFAMFEGLRNGRSSSA